jgi:UPF0755 protein
MSQGNRSTRSNKKRRRPGAGALLARTALTIAVIVVLAVAGGLLIRSMGQRGGGIALGAPGAPGANLNPVEAAALGAYLAVNESALNTAADPAAGETIFAVEAGETAGGVADRLAAEGYISDETLFRRYLHYRGIDVQIEAGSYRLSASMTPQEIAEALTEALPPEVTARVTEGWRKEQIADWVGEQADLPFGAADFTVASSSTAILPVDMALRNEIPVDATLEGFLFPDTYRLALDATAEDFVRRMVETFDERVTPELRADAAARGMTLYEVVTLASIVEREAAVPDERPTIASVYLNRLAAGMKLEADPTVQYAMGFQLDTGQWWNLNLTQADYYAVDSPYNTYLYPGLPPGPIASPGLDAIRAVVYPADTAYLYFRAACDDSGRHNFSFTFEEHVANACP